MGDDAQARQRAPQITVSHDALQSGMAGDFGLQTLVAKLQDGSR